MSIAIEPGSVIDGKYRVLRRIGEGGMGTVYEGENVRIERRVAIKVLHEHVASSPEFSERFEREARASARIGSQHVCDVLDLGDLPNGERFIVMEFLDGESLEERLRRGPLTVRQLAPIAFEILEGLGKMHHAGVIHRDLKPANIFLAKGRSRHESVKILDFGVAKIVATANQPDEMTSTGMMMGTPLYMSPEQARGARDVDGRTDLYAASVIFYRALTGVMPHAGQNLHELLFKVVLEDPRHICEIVPDIDGVFANIVMKGLTRDADERYLSAREYQEAIAAWATAIGPTSFSFNITLPSEPPPLRSLSGNFPAASLSKAKVGSSSVPLSGPRSPRMPLSDKAKAESVPPAPANRQGTPTAWADDAPVIAKRALAELELKNTRRSPAVGGGKTEVIPGVADVPLVTGSPGPVKANAAPEQASVPGKTRLAAVAIAFTLVA
ncbi:MAG TPA: protein kinase, partial [Labilithrix sp.]|nr:protein kinase [Labilithrix sp.]